MRFLVAYDGSKTAKDAVRLAKSHAKDFNAKVFAVACLAKPHEIKTEDMNIMQKLDQDLSDIKRQFNAEDISCEPHLLVEDVSPGECLVGFATANDIDLIFIGVRRRSKVGKLVFGSTAQYVILEAPCPVVTVK